MKIYAETNLDNFDAWSGGLDTKNAIINAGKEEEFEAYIEEIYPDGIDCTALNDILWFQREELYAQFNLDENGNPIDDEKEEEDDNETEEN
jgi:hypothetical protein